MPTYGPLGTTISLYTWDASAGRPLTGQGDASDCEVECVREDKFDNQGLDFLGPSSVPFFLVNAGQDLFSPVSASDGGDAAAPAAEAKDTSSTPSSALAKSTSLAAKSPLAIASPTNDLMDSDHDTTLSTLNSSLFEMSPRGDMDAEGDTGASTCLMLTPPTDF